MKVLTRETILNHGQRLDGRRFDEIRPITCEVGLLPRTHGSALFTRGETQALVTATLGTSDDAQIIEEYEGESEHTFLLHYNFPPFSVGEAKFMRGPSRRDIGHGNLARRSLSPVLPNEDAFPYTVRVVSDILESNGSSSMATRLRRHARAHGRRASRSRRRSPASRWASCPTGTGSRS